MKSNEQMVVLDESPLNGDRDLSWDHFLTFGHITCYLRTKPEEILKRCKEASMILTNKVSLGEEILKQLPKLRYIGVLATGVDMIDFKAVKKRKITVTNIPSYSTASVSQCVFAHLLSHVMGVEKHSASVKKGMWSKGKDFAYWLFPLQEIGSLTMGIIGLGKIGQQTAKVAKSFGMNVIAFTPSGKSKGAEVTLVSTLSEICQQSDVISLHCPLNEKTRKMVNRLFLSQMKPSAILINTSRGGLIDEIDLQHALNHRQIKGAALDVLSKEPPPKNHPLLRLKKNASPVTLTPHFAWGTVSARKRLMKIAFDNIDAFLKGKKTNQINLF